MKTVIEKGTISELEDIVRFQIGMAMESEGIVLDSEKLHSGVKAALENPSLGEYLVARNEEGTLMGSLLITKEWSDWNCCNYWRIQSVYVRPEFRKNGVFTAMFNEIKRLAGEAGSTSLRLYVDSANTNAQAVYLRLDMKRSHYLMFEEDF